MIKHLALDQARQCLCNKGHMGWERVRAGHLLAKSPAGKSIHCCWVPLCRCWYCVMVPEKDTALPDAVCVCKWVWVCRRRVLRCLGRVYLTWL